MLPVGFSIHVYYFNDRKENSTVLYSPTIICLLIVKTLWWNTFFFVWIMGWSKMSHSHSNNNNQTPQALATGSRLDQTRPLIMFYWIQGLGISGAIMHYMRKLSFACNMWKETVINILIAYGNVWMTTAIGLQKLKDKLIFCPIVFSVFIKSILLWLWPWYVIFILSIWKGCWMCQTLHCQQNC